MLGAIAGDIVGSIYEHEPVKTRDFPLFAPGCDFTDDTVCTVAVADCLMNAGDFAAYLRRYVRAHPGRGYGGKFLRWALTDDQPPYGSWGNGAAMRACPVAYVARDEDHALALAKAQAEVSHNHPDAIAGAQATVLAIWRARAGLSKATIRATLEDRFDYNLSESAAELRGWYEFDISAAGTVPAAVICALDADSWEDAVRNAVALGGDADTLACIAGGIAEALYGLPDTIADKAMSYLEPDLLRVVERFRDRYVQL